MRKISKHRTEISKKFIENLGTIMYIGSMDRNSKNIDWYDKEIKKKTGYLSTTWFKKVNRPVISALEKKRYVVVDNKYLDEYLFIIDCFLKTFSDEAKAELQKHKNKMIPCTKRELGLKKMNIINKLDEINKAKKQLIETTQLTLEEAMDILKHFYKNTDNKEIEECYILRLAMDTIIQCDDISKIDFKTFKIIAECDPYMNTSGTDIHDIFGWHYGDDVFNYDWSTPEYETFLDSLPRKKFNGKNIAIEATRRLTDVLLASNIEDVPKQNQLDDIYSQWGDNLFLAYELEEFSLSDFEYVHILKQTLRSDFGVLYKDDEIIIFDLNTLNNKAVEILVNNYDCDKDLAFRLKDSFIAKKTKRSL